MSRSTPSASEEILQKYLSCETFLTITKYAPCLESSFRKNILLESFYTVFAHLRPEASLPGTPSVACDSSSWLLETPPYHPKQAWEGIHYSFLKMTSRIKLTSYKSTKSSLRLSSFVIPFVIYLSSDLFLPNQVSTSQKVSFMVSYSLPP